MVEDPVIEVRDLCKAYGRTTAVDGVSFEVAAGEVFGLLGPNGAGKSTTVTCLQGLQRADSGLMRVLGLDPGPQSRSLRRRIGSQLQDSALPDRIKVWEAVDLFAARCAARADREGLLDEWGLAGKRNASFGSLSGGQRQRLFIALALVNRPELVFLDEMTAGLDPAARRTAWTLIEAVRDRGATVVLVTHFMDEAERLCDRVAVMSRGRVVAVGEPATLIAEHAGGVRVRFTWDGTIGEWLEAVPYVREVTRSGTEVLLRGCGPVLQHVAAALLERGIEPADLRVERTSLEDAYLALTGESLGAGQ